VTPCSSPAGQRCLLSLLSGIRHPSCCTFAPRRAQNVYKEQKCPDSSADVHAFFPWRIFRILHRDPQMRMNKIVKTSFLLQPVTVGAPRLSRNTRGMSAMLLKIRKSPKKQALIQGSCILCKDTVCFPQRSSSSFALFINQEQAMAWSKLQPTAASTGRATSCERCCPGMLRIILLLGVFASLHWPSPVGINLEVGW